MCGCGKRSAPRRGPTLRPSIGPLSTGIPAGASPSQVRALGLQSATTPKSVTRLDSDRRRIEKLRREAVRRALNK